MANKAGILVFPGSNCDHDAFRALELYDGLELDFLWHKDQFNPSDYDIIVVPGGFSYGDYLRSGAMARFSPVMQSVTEYAGQGRTLIGICNGFQILCEAHLLPGALTRNRTLKHIARSVGVKRVNKTSLFTREAGDDELILPVSHSEGAYYIDQDGLKKLQDKELIAFRYTEDINGSVDGIAGVLSEKGNVLGMMPHPERAMLDLPFQRRDGLKIFDSVLKTVTA